MKQHPCRWNDTSRFMMRHISKLEGVMFIPAWLGELVSRFFHWDVSGSLAEEEFYMSWHQANLWGLFFLFRACCFWQQMRLALMPCRLNHKWHRSVWIRCGVCSAPCAKTNRPNVTQPMLALSFVLYDTLWVLSRPKCVEIAQITHSPHRP